MQSRDSLGTRSKQESKTMSNHAPYILDGSHASYATAANRSDLLKKRILFVERLPASKRFREYVRPTSEVDRKAGSESVTCCGGEVFMNITLQRPLTRVGSPMAVA
ncbi:MAG: hypothetical protein ACI9QQ_002430 [Myxococcota bacterium]|jgi:hypothetical protein